MSLEIRQSFFKEGENRKSWDTRGYWILERYSNFLLVVERKSMEKVKGVWWDVLLENSMYKENYKEKVYNKGEKIILVNGVQIFMQLKQNRVFGHMKIVKLFKIYTEIRNFCKMFYYVHFIIKFNNIIWKQFSNNFLNYYYLFEKNYLFEARRYI